MKEKNGVGNLILVVTALCFVLVWFSVGCKRSSPSELVTAVEESAGASLPSSSGSVTEGEGSVLTMTLYVQSTNDGWIDSDNFIGASDYIGALGKNKNKALRGYFEDSGFTDSDPQTIIDVQYCLLGKSLDVADDVIKYQVVGGGFDSGLRELGSPSGWWWECGFTGPIAWSDVNDMYIDAFFVPTGRSDGVLVDAALLVITYLDPEVEPTPTRTITPTPTPTMLSPTMTVTRSPTFTCTPTVAFTPTSTYTQGF